MSEEQRYWLALRDKPGFLIALLRALAGNAHVSFEGDLSHCDLSEVPGVSAEETECLKRATLAPRLDFVVCPLELTSVEQVLSAMLPESRFMHDVIHIQIEKHGRLAFGAYDNFHPDCTVAWPDVPPELLRALLANGVIRSLELADGPNSN